MSIEPDAPLLLERRIPSRPYGVDHILVGFVTLAGMFVLGSAATVAFPLALSSTIPVVCALLPYYFRRQRLMVSRDCIAVSNHFVFWKTEQRRNMVDIRSIRILPAFQTSPLNELVSQDGYGSAFTKRDAADLDCLLADGSTLTILTAHRRKFVKALADEIRTSVLLATETEPRLEDRRVPTNQRVHDGTRIAQNDEAELSKLRGQVEVDMASSPELRKALGQACTFAVTMTLVGSAMIGAIPFIGVSPVVGWLVALPAFVGAVVLIVAAVRLQRLRRQKFTVSVSEHRVTSMHFFDTACRSVWSRDHNDLDEVVWERVSLPFCDAHLSDVCVAYDQCGERRILWQGVLKTDGSE